MTARDLQRRLARLEGVKRAVDNTPDEIRIVFVEGDGTVCTDPPPLVLKMDKVRRSTGEMMKLKF